VPLVDCAILTHGFLKNLFVRASISKSLHNKKVITYFLGVDHGKVYPLHRS